MNKILIIASFDRSLLLFRGELIRSWLSKGYSIIAAAPGTGVAKALQELGVRYKTVYFNRTGLNPLKDFILLLKMILLIRKEKPDIIYAYTIKPVIYGSIASSFYRNVKVYSMITGLGYVFVSSGGQGFLGKLVSFMYRLALKYNEKVFFQNPDDREFFINKRLVDDQKTVLVNGSGVHLEHYSYEPVITGPIVFLMIARLLEEKGIREYVEAAGVVREKYPDARFKLIAWNLSHLSSASIEDDLDRWKKEGPAEIYGETDDVRPYIANASVYVLPSYREGTPRTVLEAMAMGRPIITTDVPGCRETVIEGLNGFLVPVKNSRALAEAMIRFVEKPELIKKMGLESRKLAEKKFDVHEVNRVINQAMGLS